MNTQVVLFGEVNAGKSSLFNALIKQPRAIVSDKPGTTTDPVLKAMELLPYGPVTLVDTAGLYDGGELGEARIKKTKRWLDIADAALYVIDPARFDQTRYEAMVREFDTRALPYLVVLMKSDTYDAAGFTDPLFFHVSVYDEDSVERLREALAGLLMSRVEKEKPLAEGLIQPGGVALLVVPIDSAAPAGRLILPQVQFIRSCLDYGVRCHVTTDTDFAAALRELPRVDMVVTDSQVFAAVGEQTPPEIPLTSFSILTARQKGDFAALYEGAKQIRALKPGDCVLIAEACTHNAAHEDIGRVKLPRMLEKIAGSTLTFTFCAGKEFPEVVSPYALVVHCGGCMLTPRAFLARQNAAARCSVPFTNFGMALAEGSGILQRAVTPFIQELP